MVLPMTMSNKKKKQQHQTPRGGFDEMVNDSLMEVLFCG